MYKRKDGGDVSMKETGTILIFLFFAAACLFAAVRCNLKASEAIGYYQEYYEKTETFLDSLGVKGDNIIFTLPVGQDYLDAKMQLDEYNSEESN